jgi:Arylsulfotransferase (ASST)
MNGLRSASRSTRRWLLVLAVGVAGAYLAGLVSPAVFGLTNAFFAPPPVEASGVVTYDRANTDNGYVSVGVDQTVQLISKAGAIVHSWTLESPLHGMATMYPDGSLLYMGVPPAGTSGAKFPGAFGAAVLRRVDWNGHLVWSFDDSLLTHDFVQLPDGTIAALRLEPLSSAISSRVAGGTPGTELNGVMWANQIVETDPKTKVERVVFDIAKAWRPEDHPLPDFMPRSEWTHANSIFYTPSDPLTHQQAYLISFRDVSTILLVSRATGEIIWSYGGDWVLDQQHDATLLANGHVLLFDDGQYRRDAVSASQLLEIDPNANQVVWSYSGYGVAGSSFYSPIIGGAQRLPNGDTLATLGTKGQLMEVTSNGRVVWDYRVRWGPVDPKYPAEHISALFKSRSYPASEVDPLLKGR